MVNYSIKKGKLEASEHLKNRFQSTVPAVRFVLKTDWLQRCPPHAERTQVRRCALRNAALRPLHAAQRVH
jgi:hypothetical protein